ncbi:MAG: glycosyltransferase [Finegoldia magna]|jgi:rhamnosyltransferase|uniref:glycosyltransferase n=1 Tax=uncultured Leuconostoc sp. TaxID=173262 RepID=UPI0028045783|nr:glycosyltransferase [uncultured Leuconostoc sp.]MDU7298883.1 glycosyltransferase [Finegoldia magna]
MNKIGIAVIISTYNGGKFIEEQIDSILNQSYFKCTDNNYDLKLIIRDDGSSDATTNILESYAKKYKEIKILEDKLGNIGVVRSFFELLKQSADYDIIFFSDQDDIWLNHKVEKFIEVYNKSNSNDVIGMYSDAWIADDKGKSEGTKMSQMYDWLNRPLSVEFLTWGFRITGANYAINNKAAKIVLQLSKNEIKNVAMHDAAIGLLIEIVGKNILINEPLLNYRQHANNVVGAKGSASNPIKKIIDLRKLVNSIVLNNASIYNFLRSKKFGVSTDVMNHLKKYNDITVKHTFKETHKILKDIKKDIWWRHKRIALFFVWLNKVKK